MIRQCRLITPNTSITNFTSKPEQKKTSPWSSTLNESTKRKSLNSSLTITTKKIREIRSQVPSQEISPEHAAIVVKDYIMPLFRIDKKNKHTRRRSEDFATKAKTFQEVGLLSEFKLVEELNLQIDSLKKKLEISESQLNSAIQEKKLYEIDYKTLTNEYLNSQSNCTFFNFLYSQNIKKTHQENFNSWVIKDQCQKYKSLYEDELSNIETMSKVIEDEKSNCDKIKNIAVKLEYINSLLVMENDLLGEKLKGLILSLEHILGSHSHAMKCREEVEIMKESTFKMSEEIKSDQNLFKLLKEEQDELEFLIKSLTDLTQDVNDKKSKQIRLLKENINRLKSENEFLSNNRDKYKDDLEELSKKYSILQEEFVKLKKKIQKYKTKNDEFEEKYCKNCQEKYFEASNYNWSCKRHSCEYSEGQFWCCGSTEKSSIGCFISKHIANENLESKDRPEEIYIQFCSTCKNSGHACSECPKDPNTRSQFDPEDELIRIKEGKKKKKLNIESHAMKTKFLKMVIRRIKKYDTFGNFEIDVEKEKHKEWFADILKYKKDFALNDGNLNELLKRL